MIGTVHKTQPMMLHRRIGEAMKRQASRANHNQVLQHIHRQKYGFPPSMLKAELATTAIALIIIGVCLYLFN